MAYDDRRAAEKTAEIVGVAKDAVLRHWGAVGVESTDAEAQAVAEQVTAAYVRVTPPEAEELTSSLITMDMGGRGGARSRKPGNLLLNVRALVATLSNAVLGAAGVASAPWTAPFAALVIWDTVWAGMAVDLNERDATVLFAMWSARDQENRVPHATLLKAVNLELAKHNRPPVAAQELVTALDHLQRLKAIERAADDPENWWLREWVSVKYK